MTAREQAWDDWWPEVADWVTGTSNTEGLAHEAFCSGWEAGRARLREPLATLTGWLEHLPQRHIPLRAAEALARLQALTAP